MACDFSIYHYEEILRTALDSGYNFKGFHEADRASAKIIYLRHDVDICLHMAASMAELEATLGVRSTYFVLLNSPFYNLLEDQFLKAVYKISNLGHWIGIHLDLPEITKSSYSLDEAVDLLFNSFNTILPLQKVVSFHRPGPNVLNKRIAGYTSTYNAKFFSEIKYLSDSRKTWREYCPCKILSEKRFPKLQIVMHPIWWGTEENLKLLGKSIIKKRYLNLTKYLVENIAPFKILTGQNGDLI